jgi:beta-N-acetylhexosaminidase
MFHSHFFMELSQLFILGVPANGDVSAIREFQPGGVILMGRNAAPLPDIQRLTRSIREAGSTPPFICIDHEGGRVQRLKDGFSILPPARELGNAGANAVAISAMNAAAELRAAGINFNFAPVCDVPTHADDTVIASRAFSDDPIRAASLVAEYVRGAQPTVLCCAKHFPGHGGVGVDSHKGLPTFEGTLQELKDTHLPPFRAAIGAGIAAVMPGHIAVPCLGDGSTPASLSPIATTKLLREEMRFDDLIITDDLEMGALEDGDAGEIGVRALLAGCDVLLFCHAPEKAMRARDAIEAALASGVLSAARIEESLQRVRAAKAKYGIL